MKPCKGHFLEKNIFKEVETMSYYKSKTKAKAQNRHNNKKK